MYMSVGERFTLTNTNYFLTFQKNLFIDAFKIWWTNYVGQGVLAKKVTRINETTWTKLQTSLGGLIPQSLEFEEMASRIDERF